VTGLHKARLAWSLLTTAFRPP